MDQKNNTYTKAERLIARILLLFFAVLLLVGLFCLITANMRGLLAVLFCLIVLPCIFYGFKLYVSYTVRRRQQNKHPDSDKF